LVARGGVAVREVADLLDVQAVESAPAAVPRPSLFD
jgi:hypothetical protein